MPRCSGPNPMRDRGTHSCPDAFGFIRGMVACWLWRRFLDFLRKVKQDSLGFTFIGAKIAPDLIFLARAATITLLNGYTPNMRVICLLC